MPYRSVAIYCNFIQPGGVERVSIRLNDLLNNAGIESALVSREGDNLFSAETARATRDMIRGRVLVFSRKRDLFELGPRSLLARRLVYWRHIPYFQTSWGRRVIDKAFVALISRMGWVVANCDQLAEETCALPFIAKDRVITCYSPLGEKHRETDTIRPIRDPERVHLLYFGRESDQKRVSDAIFLVDMANKQGLSVDMSVYGYSGQPNDVPDSPHVHFLGRTDDAFGEMSRTDGLVLYSRYESFPTVLVEAAQSGAPIFCNAFRTGLEDFERLIGPTNRISVEEADSLAVAIRNAATGTYNLNALTDEKVLGQWLRALDLIGNDAHAL